jgi:hypothetical protein
MRIHDPNSLDLIADGYASSAENAFGAVADDRRAGAVDYIFGFYPFESEFIDLNLLAEIL